VARANQNLNGDLLQGTLDLLVLSALKQGPMHGWGITERLELGSEGVLKVGQGSLYTALYRLEAQGYVASEWSVSDNNRRARVYTLTRAGKRRLTDEKASWERMSRAIQLVVRLADA